VTKKLVAYGIVGLVIAIALIAGLQVRPQTVLPSTGQVQISITGGPLITDPLSVTCHGNTNHMSQRDQVENLTSLVVNISSVQVHRTGELNLTGDWITLSNAPKTLDLLDLTSFNQLLGSTSMPDGVINLVRLTVGFTATAGIGIGTGSKSVTVSSGHLDVQTNAQVTSGKVTSITLELVQPHVVCQGNGDLRLTPELTATSETTD
jgi:Domain of unknown function (DUF4382)